MNDLSPLETKLEPSHIGAGIVVTGRIETSGDLVIDGQIVGDLRCGTLVVGEGGVVSGDLQAVRTKVAGTIDGTVSTRDLAIEATGSVSGEIAYARLRVANGGLIKGRLTCAGDKDSAADPVPLDMVGVFPRRGPK